jgi:hypothetical protein
VWPVSEFEVEIRTVLMRRRYATRSSTEIVAELKSIARPLFLDVDAILYRGNGQQDISLGEMEL